MPLLNLIRYFSVSYLHSLVKNLVFFLKKKNSKAAKTKLASKRVLLVYKLTILKFIGLLK